MNVIENAAFISVGRACGFGGFAILLLMAGLSFDPPMATRTGGMLCLGTAFILSVYAVWAPRRPYKRTELWMLLAKDYRPPAEIAQRVVGEVLRVTYISFAKQAVGLAAILLVMSGMLDLIF